MITELLKLHEGSKKRGDKHILYKCTADKNTIGYGRNLDANGLSEDEALYLLANDLRKAQREVDAGLPWFKDLDEVRKAVLIDMCFNLGWQGLSKFRFTLGLVEKREYGKASEAMLQSLWAKQVKGRARRLAEMMKTGEWPSL